MVGKEFKDIKIKRTDKVNSLAKMTSIIKIGNQEIEINPMILFQRMLMCINSPDDVKEFLKYEISSYPQSIFNENGMRKNVKSNLFEEFSNVDISRLINTDIYVIDGGFLLHKVKWNKCTTYKDVCDNYVHYIVKTFKSAVIVFDGYKNENSIKKSEQFRQYLKKKSPHFVITEETPLSMSQEKFLSNCIL